MCDGDPAPAACAYTEHQGDPVSASAESEESLEKVSVCHRRVQGGCPLCGLEIKAGDEHGIHLGYEVVCRASMLCYNPRSIGTVSAL